jgi:hypothetical protein
MSRVNMGQYAEISADFDRFDVKNGILGKTLLQISTIKRQGYI